MAACPKCSKSNSDDAAFCGFCGARLVPKEEPPAKKTIFGYRVDFKAGPVVQGGAETDQDSEIAESVATTGSAFAKTQTESEQLADTLQEKPSFDEVAFATTQQGHPDGEAVSEQIPPPESVRTEEAPVDDTSTVPIPTGEEIGGYWVGTKGYRLSIGEVFPAKDTSNNLDFQLLLVDKDVFPSSLDLERSRRELGQLEKLECSEILKIVNHGKNDEGQLYVVSEVFVGRTLGEVVSEKTLDLAKARRVISAVGRGLAEAQKVGVIHRDLSLENILIGDDGTVKVRGFGLARPLAPNIFGTPEFLSPEQSSGRPVDQRSNIYSLGALMFYILSGRPPFVGSSVEEILEKHRRENPPSIKEVCLTQALPEQVDLLINKALSKSSSRRHLTLRQFLREIDTLPDMQEPQVAESTSTAFATPVHGITALKSEEQTLQKDEDEKEVGRKPVTSDSHSSISGATGFGTAIKPISGVIGDPASPTVIDLEQAVAAAPAPKKGQVPKVVSSPPKGATDQPAGFRETMWFHKGEVESALAQEGVEPIHPAISQELPSELTAKYADDGSMSEEEAKKLSLRTGRTQAMSVVNIPSGKVPGKHMAAEEFVSEMDRGRKIVKWTVAIVVLACIGGAVVWYFLR